MLIDSLARALYDKLFDWIIMKINASIEPSSPPTIFLGLLDIFGFEIFDKNSLEQFLINTTNEMLQSNFVEVVFRRVR